MPSSRLQCFPQFFFLSYHTFDEKLFYHFLCYFSVFISFAGKINDDIYIIVREMWKNGRFRFLANFFQALSSK